MRALRRARADGHLERGTRLKLRLSQVTLSHFPFDAAVHSPVRVLGDRSVLYKYVNRNALGVGVYVPGHNKDPFIQARLPGA